MANPQLEDGYIGIANDIAEALMRINLSAHESRVLWFIFRTTYGWEKKVDWISLSQFEKCIGLDRRLIHRAIKNLTMKNIIVIQRDDGIRVSYGIQKDFDKWIPDAGSRKHPKQKQAVIIEPSSKGILSSKGMTTVIQRDDEPSSKGIPTRTTITKENIYSMDFLEFWKAYPKKSGSKKIAFDNWNKLNGQRPEIGIILEAISNQTEWRKNANGEFRPEWKDPERWLKGRMWEAETGKPVANSTEKPKKYTVIDPKDIMDRQRRRDEGELLL
jgi:phage replication O-like protein O